MPLFKILKILSYLFVEEKKNTIIIFLQFKEIKLQPEVPSPLCFRIQGGTLSVTDEGGTEIIQSNIGLSSLGSSLSSTKNTNYPWLLINNVWISDVWYTW